MINYQKTKKKKKKNNNVLVRIQGCHSVLKNALCDQHRPAIQSDQGLYFMFTDYFVLRSIQQNSDFLIMQQKQEC